MTQRHMSIAQLIDRSSLGAASVRRLRSHTPVAVRARILRQASIAGARESARAVTRSAARPVPEPTDGGRHGD